MLILNSSLSECVAAVLLRLNQLWESLVVIANLGGWLLLESMKHSKFLENSLSKVIGDVSHHISHSPLQLCRNHESESWCVFFALCFLPFPSHLTYLSLFKYGTSLNTAEYIKVHWNWLKECSESLGNSTELQTRRQGLKWQLVLRFLLTLCFPFPVTAI